MVTYGLKFYDGIWLDWTAKDYEILPLTYRGDVLDELEITVCQFNVMVSPRFKIYTRDACF